MDTRSLDAMEPLVFAILASITPKDIELEFFDERLGPIPIDHDTDLVAMSVGTFTARRAYQIAASFHQRRIKVVLGGYHPTFLPEEALVYADAIVIGDAEEVWEELIQDAQQGKLKQVYRQLKQPSLHRLKFDRSIFKGKRYKPIIPVQIGRGCRFACDFCSVHAFYGSHMRQRPVDEVIAEIESLDAKFIMFIDSNLFIDLSKTEELFQRLIPLNIHWGGQISLDLAKKPHLIDLMAKSGCFAVAIGFESLSLDNLRLMNKEWNLENDKYDTAIQQFHDRGIIIYASFIFGYDHDTIDTFDRTIDFAIQSGFALANLVPLTPTPHSRLYSRLQNENRLLFKRWWLDPAYRYGQATFHPHRMTADELTEGCMRARQEFYRYGAVLKRVTNTSANRHNLRNLGLFMAANLITRRELSYKLGHRLGAETPLVPELENMPLSSATS
jgi:radical SAM superfamily enzyme YgiQ (UPF0313 family)